MANNTLTAGEFAERVTEALKGEQRSIAWLARQVEVPPSTLRYQLANPSALSLDHALPMSRVTGVAL